MRTVPQSGEVTQLHQFRFLRGMLAEPLQGIIHGRQFVVLHGRGDLYRHTLAGAIGQLLVRRARQRSAQAVGR